MKPFKPNEFYHPYKPVEPISNLRVDMTQVCICLHMSYKNDAIVICVRGGHIELSGLFEMKCSIYFNT